MKAIFKRELYNYFNTKTTLIFAGCFVFIANFLAFYVGGILELNNASMLSFFAYHPWLYCLLLPAVSTPLIADESKKGSIEVLFSLPQSSFAISLGKFLAAWTFTGICLIATMTLWGTLNFLASPDNLMIFSGYIASFMLAGCFLVIGINVSTLTNSSTIAFIITVTLGILLLIISNVGDLSFIQNIMPDFIIKAIYTFDLMPAYHNMTNGIIKLSNIIVFFAFIFLGLVVNFALLERKKL